MFEHNWTIEGSDAFADALRDVAPVVPSDTPITVTTDSSAAQLGAWVVGPAVLRAESGRYVPFYAAFEAIEETRQTLANGSTGKAYGLFGSFRVSRETAASDVAHNALLPVLGIALDMIPDRVARVWAANQSLMADGDAWFVHLRTESEILITLEAIACCEPSAGPELLIEVTAHDRVLRAEPMRQSIVVEALGKPAAAFAWWEDQNERFLKLVLERNGQPDDGAAARIREVWDAIQRSSGTGQPVELT